MIKKIALTLAIAGLSICSYGQGTVIFATATSGSNPATNPNSVARVIDQSTGLPVFGSAYYAQLYVSDIANPTMHAVGTAVNFKGTASSQGTAGYVQTSGTSVGANGSVAVNNTPTVTQQNSGAINMQIRAWSSAFTTYEGALAASAFTGTSAIFSWVPAYGLNQATDLTVANAQAGTNPGYAALGSFQVTGVPEPSTIALGVMGLSTLLFRRRK